MIEMIEVELKFAVESLEDLRSQLESLGAQSNGQLVQEDEYLNDPKRDFARTDQALRIRRTGEQYFLTYKGPNLDAVAKIRKEIEIPLVDACCSEQLREVFLEMDFVSVAKVSKRRESMLLRWQQQRVEASLDDVHELGGFCELETVVESEQQAAAAKETLMSLANELGLLTPIRTSYLVLLLTKRGQI